MLTVVTPPAADALTTLAALKAELQVTDGSQDSYLQRLIAEASSTIASHCGRVFGRQTVRQVDRPQRSIECIILEAANGDEPVTVTAVAEDGATVDPTGYELDGALLYRIRSDAPSPWRARKIEVTYAVGWLLPGDPAPDLPAVVGRCCIDLCARAFNARGRDPALRSERVLDVISQSWDTGGGDGYTGGLPNDVADRLRPFRRVFVA